MTNRFLEGNGYGYVEAGLPNIIGESQINASVGVDYTGAFYKSDDKTIGSWSNVATAPSLSFDASLSNSIYGNSQTVQPATCLVYFIIKY